MNRSRLAIWNYLSTVLFTLITLLGLVVTQYVAHKLGNARWGAARMVAGWLGVFSIFEVAFGSTLAPLIARALAQNDEKSLQATLAAGLRALAGLVGLIFVAGMGMLFAITWLIPIAETDDLRLAWCVGVIGLTPIILSPFRALADARQQGYRINLALIGQSLLIFGLSALFASRGYGITGQVAASTIAALFLASFLTRDGLRSFPGMLRALRSARPDPTVWKSILHLGVPTFLVTLSGRVSVLTDDLIVGKIIAPETAALLSYTIKLTTTGQTQLQAIGNACWAGLAELHAQGQQDAFNKRLVELTGVVTILAIAGLGPVVAYSGHFVRLWMGENQYLGDAIVVLSAINAFLLGLFSLWFWCFSGTGKVGSMLPAVVAGAVLNVATSIILTFRYGAIGPICGTTVSFVTISLWYLPLSLRRHFGTSISDLFRAVERPFRVGGPFTILLYFVAAAHTPFGWLGLAVEMSAAALVFLGLAYVFLLERTQREVWAARIRGALRRS